VEVVGEEKEQGALLFEHSQGQGAGEEWGMPAVGDVPLEVELA